MGISIQHLKRAFSVTACLIPVVAAAQTGPDDDEAVLEEITVTGSFRVTAGGAQDIEFARGEIERGRIPHPDTMTAEGLLSQHDLLLPAGEPCAQLFCITAEAVTADLPTLPGARYLVGLGFSSNIEPAGWQRAPVNLVAVVDKSGSMSGRPLALVRRSLRRLVESMDSGDQLSIVLYGDRSHIYLSPTPVDALSRGALIAAIDAIESEGSTNMEAGLSVGFDLANRSRAAHAGLTRVVLFTDERPNVGRTDAGSFSGMAEAASRHGIGLTTIGVGVQFDTKLATALSSTRGGNLFFLDSKEAADIIFADELDYMVSELAHDVEITLRPDVNYRIAGIYGVPGELLGWHDETSVTVRIPTVFLSQRGGGIFVSLAAAEAFNDLPLRPSAARASLMAATASYLPLHASVPESTALAVSQPGSKASDAMALAHLLIDEFLSLRAATTAHYVKNDQETAYQILRGLEGRFATIGDRHLQKRVDGEHELVGTLLDRMAFLSGHSSEGRGRHGTPLWGNWRVVGLEGDDYLCEVGDVLSFSMNNELSVLVPGADASLDSAEQVYFEDTVSDYWVTKREILVPDEDLAARYAIEGDRLTLRIREDDWWDAATIELERVEQELRRE